MWPLDKVKYVDKYVDINENLQIKWQVKCLVVGTEIMDKIY